MAGRKRTTKPETPEPASRWRSRIVDHGTEPPGKLLPNPANWRIHSKAQEDALSGVLDQVGWVQDVIVNRQTGHLIDGHLRVALAVSAGEPGIPVVYVDLDPAEEALVLASLDPLAGMAATDGTKLVELLSTLTIPEGALGDLLGAAADASVKEVPFELPNRDGQRWRSIHLTMTDEQYEIVSAAITKAADEARATGAQSNVNAAAMVLICEGWSDGRG